MKKLVLMTIASALVWTACGNKNAATNTTATTPSVTTAATTTEPAANTATQPSTAAANPLAEEGATAMCGCAAVKSMADLKKQMGAAADDKAKAALGAKMMEATKGVQTCIAAVDAKVKALSQDEQNKFKADFEAAFTKQCPDLATALK